jgi:hypothetical protein
MDVHKQIEQNEYIAQLEQKLDVMEEQLTFMQKQVDFAETAFSIETGEPLDWEVFYSVIENDNKAEAEAEPETTVGNHSLSDEQISQLM